MTTSSRLALAALAAASFFQLPVQAAELFVADAQGELWRYGAETHSRINVGELPAPLIGLEFLPNGELFGLANDGRIWTINSDNAEAVPVASGDTTDRYLYRDFVSFLGDFILLRWDRTLYRAEITRLNPTTGDEQLLGAITNSDGELFLGARSLYFSGLDNLILMDSDTLYFLPLTDLVAWPADEPFPVTAADLTVDPEALRAWVISEVTAGEAGLKLVAVDAQSRAIDPQAPSYSFPLGSGPRAIAFKAPDDVCPQDSETLCLQDGRFRLTATWRDFANNEGVGSTVFDRSETAGQFWFFGPDNHELLVKVIDGCSNNGHYWVFLAGTTNVEFALTVVDFSTNTSNLYSNALGATVETRLDTAAFPCQLNTLTEEGL